MTNEDYAELLAELRSIRRKLDEIGARIASENARFAALPVWDCGHRHSTRGEAIRCKAGVLAEEDGA